MSGHVDIQEQNFQIEMDQSLIFDLSNQRNDDAQTKNFMKSETKKEIEQKLKTEQFLRK